MSARDRQMIYAANYYMAQHGTAARYERGCQCTDCTRAASGIQLYAIRRSRAGEPWVGADSGVEARPDSVPTHRPSTAGDEAEGETNQWCA